MMTEKIKLLIRNKVLLLTLLAFGIILLSRLLYLGSDTFCPGVELEEKLGGYNARTMIYFHRWPLHNNWFQSMVYAPVQNILSYLAFLLLGVGLTQFRLPMVIASFIGLFFFYLILKKQVGYILALLGLLLYASNFEVTVWNRSALTENLYLLFMPLSVYFLSKKELKSKDLFYWVFFAAMSVVAKLDGYPFYLSVVIFLTAWSLRNHSSILKNFKALTLGTLAALGVLFFLFILTGSFSYLAIMYRFYFELFGTQASLLKGMIPTLKALVSIFLGLDPYSLLTFLVTLPIFLVNRHLFNKTDKFILLFFIIAFLTRLQVPAEIIYWKRVIYLYFPMYYIIVRSLFFLIKENSGVSVFKTTKQIFIDLILITICLSSTLYLYFTNFGKSILRPYAFDFFTESFHYSRAAFVYLLVTILVITIINAGRLLVSLEKKHMLKTLILALSFFMIFLSLAENIFKTVRLYYSRNISYSYQENEKYSKLIPKSQMIVSDEQAMRAFAYLSDHDFYFNHDGGPNPVPYREAFENTDLRYLILNVDEFRRERWGLPNKTRMELLKVVYPNIKLIDVFFASGIPLAIYDKYGNN